MLIRYVDAWRRETPLAEWISFRVADRFALVPVRVDGRWHVGRYYDLQQFHLGEPWPEHWRWAPERWTTVRRAHQPITSR